MHSIHPRAKANRGFSLVELIVSTTLTLIVLSSITSTFMVFASGAKSVGAYTDMSRQSRKALEVFARDIRAAENVVSATETDVEITYPVNSFYNGKSVEYTFDDLLGTFSRIELDNDGTITSERVLLDGVEKFSLVYFDPLGSKLAYDKASLLLSIKSLQIDSEMVRAVSRTEATDYIISARFMMRNRAVTE